jgi:excisionase family DNA binding protein
MKEESFNYTGDSNPGRILNPEQYPTKQYATKADVAKLFQVTTRTIDAWMARGLLPYLKIGRTARFSLADIETYLRHNCGIAGRFLKP